MSEHAYVAFHDCGGWVYVSVDSPDTVKDTAREVARCIREGLTVERRPVEEVRKRLIQVCRCKKERP